MGHTGIDQASKLNVLSAGIDVECGLTLRSFWVYFSGGGGNIAVVQNPPTEPVLFYDGLVSLVNS